MKTPVLEFLFSKVAELFSPATLLKRDSNTGFQKTPNTYLVEHLQMTDCFSNLKHGVRVFDNIVSSTANPAVSIKIQTMSLDLNVF